MLGGRALWSSISEADDPKVQAVVDYVSKHLLIEYKVVSNTRQNMTFVAQLTLSNQGEQAIANSPLWSIYFYHLPMIEPEQLRNYRSALIGRGDVRVTHVEGNLYRFTPTELFSTIAAGEESTFTLTAARWIVARTDMHPNWYVSAARAKPRILRCTASEKLEFFAPLTTQDQWKRVEFDRYEPWTAAQRFERNLREPVSDEVPEVLVVPTPREINIQRDLFATITKEWKVCYSADIFENEARQLADELNLHLVNSEPSHDDDLALVFSRNSLLGDEEYALKMTPSRVTIMAATSPGAFYGVKTILGLMDDSTSQLPCGTVQDAPRFSYRGLMLDVSRHFFPTSDLKQVLDVMATYKLNTLHLHLTDDEGWRLTIPGLEELTQIGGRRCHDTAEETCVISQLGSGPFSNNSGSGYYTVAQYQDLLRYAEAKHIDVIPEFDMPAHCHAAILAMEARHKRLIAAGKSAAEAGQYLLSDPDDKSKYRTPQSFTKSAINPCLDSTFNFVDYVMTTIVRIHEPVQPLRVFHFGGDEVPRGTYTDSPACKKFMETHADIKTPSAIKQYFIEKIGNMAAGKGLALQGWNDGFKSKSNGVIPRNNFANSEVRVNAWLSSNLYKNNTYILANEDYKVILSYATHLYLDHPQEPDPEAHGLYWATRFIDTRKVYETLASNAYANEQYTLFGKPVQYHSNCVDCVPLRKPENVIGVQAQLWTETVRTREHLDLMLLPRLLAVAERGWYLPPWEHSNDLYAPVDWTLCSQHWHQFATAIGQREIGRLENRGFRPYLPPPGAKYSNDDKKVFVNCAFPGLDFVYSKNGGTTWNEVKNGVIEDNLPLIIATVPRRGSSHRRRHVSPRRSLVVAVDDTHGVQSWRSIHR